MIHPETGEVLETEADLREAMTVVAEQMQPLYRLRRVIQEELAALKEPVLPPARSRTQTQDKVARCPRCNQKLESEEAAK